MTPIFFILLFVLSIGVAVQYANAEPYTLCVVYSGGEDCSYTWEYVADRQVFEWMYEKNHPWVGHKLDPSMVGGYTSYYRSQVVVNDIKWISHEANHVICKMEEKASLANYFETRKGSIYEIQQQRDKCNQAIENKDINKQSINSVDKTPEPPLITAKMYYSSLFFW